LAIQPVHIQKALEGLPVLNGRSETTEAQADEAFATLGEFGKGGLFAGSFSGQSPWERHRNGDELVQVIAGSTTLTVMEEAGPTSFEMTAGMIVVVPQGLWHRFNAPDGVTVMTATPQPTDHTFAEDPREEG
jgi:quercetin dioxygenase-like cupin family protein